MFGRRLASAKINASFRRRLDSLSHNQRIGLRLCWFLSALRDVSSPSMEATTKAIF